MANSRGSEKKESQLGGEGGERQEGQPRGEGGEGNGRVEVLKTICE